jgi:hypothetical protein
VLVRAIQISVKERRKIPYLRWAEGKARQATGHRNLSSECQVTYYAAASRKDTQANDAFERAMQANT